MAQEVEQKRVYLGGFTQAISEDEVAGRFRPFGQVHSVELPQPVADGLAPRGFAYITLSISVAQWHRCLSLYSGAKWKGGKMRVEEAKENYLARLQREREADNNAKLEYVPGNNKRTRCLISEEKEEEEDDDCIHGVLAKDMALVTGKNIERYAGWTRGRYNRPVLKLSLVKPDGKPFMYEPLRYKNGFEKLFGSVRPKDWRNIAWEYNEDEAKADFDAARKLPERLAALADASRERVAKRIESRAGRKQEAESDDTSAAASNQLERKRKQDALAVYESDEDADILDQLQMKRGRTTERQLVEDAAADMAPFEDADDIASLVANAGQHAVAPELQAKLASGAFDSDDSDSDDSDSSKPSKRLKTVHDGPYAERMTADELLDAKRERQRTSAILGQLLREADIEDTADLPEESKAQQIEGTVAFGSDDEADVSVKDDDEDEEPCDGSSSGGRKSSSNEKSSKQAEEPTSSDSSSSDESSSGSEDTSSSGSGSGSNDKDNDSSDSSDSSDDSDSDSSSDSDSDSSSDSDSDSDSDKDSDADKKEESTAMEVDQQKTPTSYSGLFEGRASNSTDNAQDQSASKISSGMFGASSSGFRFTEILGLEADEPSARLVIADGHETASAPVTGGVQLTGPPERNLNANRLPAFFPDVDSPTFMRPEPVFQRQKNIEELEKDLEDVREELSKDYKAQHRSAVKRSQKMRQKHS